MMDPQVPASFIPKKPLTESRSRGGMGGVLFLLALLIFLSSLVAGGGTFLYLGYLKSAIAAKDESLKRAEGAYDAGVIQDLIRLDGRIAQAKSLMDKHVATSAFFSYLSESTLESVQFTEFAYTLGGDGTADITLIGKGINFSAVALQSDEFGASRVLRDVIFSGITVGARGEVAFAVSATVDSSYLLYRKSLTGESSSAIEVSPTPPAVEATPSQPEVPLEPDI